MPNHRRLPPRSRPLAPDRRGFTLIEVVVALLVLQLALLALAGLAAASLRRATGAAARALAARAADRRMELIRASDACAAAAGSATLARDVRESWTVAAIAPGVVEARDSVSWPGVGARQTLVVRERLSCGAP